MVMQERRRDRIGVLAGLPSESTPFLCGYCLSEVRKNRGSSSLLESREGDSRFFPDEPGRH